MNTEPRRVYRTSVALRVALGVAGVFWAAAAGLLWSYRQEAPESFYGCIALAAFFAALLAYHTRMQIEVQGSCFRYRGPIGQMEVPYEDVLKVDVTPSLMMTLYLVVTRKGLVLFSSQFRGHQELFKLLVRRAGLEAL